MRNRAILSNSKKNYSQDLKYQENGRLQGQNYKTVIEQLSSFAIIIKTKINKRWNELSKLSI
jgi:hypothetical protein